MRFRNQALRSTYPHISYVLANLLPELRQTNPQVWSAFLDACQYELATRDSPWPVRALQRGGPLQVRVTDFRKSANGFYRAGDDVIHINTDLAAVCEYAGFAGDVPSPEITRHQREIYARRLESTLLHEAVHWARSRAGLDQGRVHYRVHPLHGHHQRGTMEAGTLFERLAYGTNVQTNRHRKIFRQHLKSAKQALFGKPMMAHVPGKGIVYFPNGYPKRSGPLGDRPTTSMRYVPGRGMVYIQR